MNASSITLEPIAGLLDRLFAEDGSGSPDGDAYLASLQAQERARLMRSKTEYGAFYTRLKDMPLAVSRRTGDLLYLLARSARSRNIVEFGTSIGISTIYLASALRENGGGKLITSEFEPSKIARARANLAVAGLSDLVDVREGDALQTLATGLPEHVDMLFLDSAKGLYPEVLALVEKRLRPGALVIADDVRKSPEFLQYIRSADSGYHLLAFDEDVEVTIRLG